MVQCHEKRQFDGWRSQSGLKAAISGDIAIPPPLPAKGWEVLREKNATKFGPNLGHTSSCGLIFPPFVGAIQARWIPKPALITHGRRQGGSKCESSIKPLPATDFYSRCVFFVHICWNFSLQDLKIKVESTLRSLLPIELAKDTVGRRISSLFANKSHLVGFCRWQQNVHPKFPEYQNIIPVYEFHFGGFCHLPDNSTSTPSSQL